MKSHSFAIAQDEWLGTKKVQNIQWKLYPKTQKLMGFVTEGYLGQQFPSCPLQCVKVGYIEGNLKGGIWYSHRVLSSSLNPSPTLCFRDRS